MGNDTNNAPGTFSDYVAICRGCGQETDPYTCHCGMDIKDHKYEQHSFVPMGCNCHRRVPEYLPDVVLPDLDPPPVVYPETDWDLW